MRKARLLVWIKTKHMARGLSPGVYPFLSDVTQILKNPDISPQPPPRRRCQQTAAQATQACSVRSGGRVTTRTRGNPAAAGYRAGPHAEVAVAAVRGDPERGLARRASWVTVRGGGHRKRVTRVYGFVTPITHSSRLNDWSQTKTTHGKPCGISVDPAAVSLESDGYTTTRAGSCP